MEGPAHAQAIADISPMKMGVYGMLAVGPALFSLRYRIVGLASASGFFCALIWSFHISRSASSQF